MMIFRLMYEFFKIGLFAVGGGPATIPFLYDLCYRLNWFSVNQLADMIAISQCTPGPLGINMATYVGYTCDGFLGGILATLSLVFPSLVVVICISKILNKFKENKYVENIFKILRPCVVGFILSAGLTIFMTSVCNQSLYTQTGNILDLFMLKESILFILLIFLVFKYRKHPIVYLALSLFVGIVFQF